MIQNKVKCGVYIYQKVKLAEVYAEVWFVIQETFLSLKIRGL